MVNDRSYVSANLTGWHVKHGQPCDWSGGALLERHGLDGDDERYTLAAVLRSVGVYEKRCAVLYNRSPIRVFDIQRACSEDSNAQLSHSYPRIEYTIRRPVTRPVPLFRAIEKLEGVSSLHPRRTPSTRTVILY